MSSLPGRTGRSTMESSNARRAMTGRTGPTMTPVKGRTGQSSSTMAPVKGRTGQSSSTMAPVKGRTGQSSSTMAPVKGRTGQSSSTMTPVKGRTGQSSSTMAQSNDEAALEAQPILAKSDSGGFALHNPDNLHKILMADDVRSKPVVVISVAGKFRTGKSFLLDMMLRYLRASDKSNWLNERRAEGFPWKNGYQPHTSGILMWSEPFPVTLPTGQEAVIVLMDTQGTFDNKSTVRESSTVFALSTLLSSLQIFNVMAGLAEDDLQHLQLFTEYGFLALDSGTEKPFQNLLFLVRDWRFSYQIPLGAAGGDQLVAEQLQNQGGKEELQKVRSHIRDCFSGINGFLLPAPGKQMVVSPDFDGDSNDMDEDFVAGLEELMPKILAPENLTTKTIGGNPVTAGGLYTFFAKYVDMFQSDKLPSPMSIMEATAHANHMVALQDAKNLYIEEMERHVGIDKESLDQDELLRKHNDAAAKAERAFIDRKKMGKWTVTEDYRLKLVSQMDDWYKFAEEANRTKREKETIDAKKHNDELVGRCKPTYLSAMESVAGETVGHVPYEKMNSVHEAAKQKALAQFEAKKKVFGGTEKESRQNLSYDIDTELRKLLAHNEVKKNEKTIKVAQANMKAVRKAKKIYQEVMNTALDRGALREEDLDHHHQKARRAAVGKFETLKQGKEPIHSDYLKDLETEIDIARDAYERTNQNNARLNMLVARIQELESQKEEEKKTASAAAEDDSSGSSCAIQ